MHHVSAAHQPRHAREASSSASAHGILNSVIVAAAAVSLAFEQSPGNEALRTHIGLNVLDSTGSPLVVGATIAAVTAGIEMGSSGLISLGLHRESGAVKRLKERLLSRKGGGDHIDDDNDARESRRGLSSLSNIGVALGLGAGLVTIKEHIAVPGRTLRQDLSTSAYASGVVAFVSGLIGYLASGGIKNAEAVGLGRPAQYVVDYGTSTTFWVVVLLAGYGIYFIKRSVDVRRATVRQVTRT